MGLFKRLKGRGGLVKSDTPPTNKNVSWLDTSGTQPIVKFFNDATSSWEVVDDNNADSIRGKNVPIPTNTEDGEILSYDFATDSMVWIEDKSGVLINDTSTTSTTEVWSANKINTELGGKQKDVVKSSTPPASPVADDLWLDTSVDPHLLKKYDGTALAWKIVGGNGNATKIQGKPVDAFSPTASEDGHVLTWDNTLGKFVLKPKPQGGGGVYSVNINYQFHAGTITQNITSTSIT